jgi:RNA polymerase sigma-70 factor (ECF subfamily)
VKTDHPSLAEGRAMEITTQVAQPASDAEERLLVEALRRGDEAAFVSLVRRYGPLMQRVALGYVRTPAVAEEVVQETWLGVLRGIDRFEGRSSLKTWLFRILVNRARTRGAREHRSLPLSSLETRGDDDGHGADAFLDASHPAWGGWWASYPSSWEDVPEERLLARETLALARQALEALPARQREVLVLRDIIGMEPEEVCTVLGVSDGNQRVLLHRGRTKLRVALAAHLDGATA